MTTLIILLAVYTVIIIRYHFNETYQLQQELARVEFEIACLEAGVEAPCPATVHRVESTPLPSIVEVEERIYVEATPVAIVHIPAGALALVYSSYQPVAEELATAPTEKVVAILVEDITPQAIKVNKTLIGKLTASQSRQVLAQLDLTGKPEELATAKVIKAYLKGVYDSSKQGLLIELIRQVLAS